MLQDFNYYVPVRIVFGPGKLQETGEHAKQYGKKALIITTGPFFQENGPILLFGLTLAGVLYSAYLTYIELFVISAICPFCVLSALCLVGLLYVSTIRLRNQWREA